MFIIVVSLICVYISYLYLFKFNFWRKRGVNGPRPIPLLGNLNRNFKKSKPDLMMNDFKTYGHVYGIYEGHNPVLMISDLNMIKNILVRDFHVFPNRRQFEVDPESIVGGFVSTKTGSEWKRVRNILTPTFTSNKMKNMFPIISDCVSDIMKTIYEENSRLGVGAKIETKKLFGSYSLDVIGRCCFATKIDSFKNPSDEFVIQVTNFLNPGKLKMLFFLILGKSKLAKKLNLFSMPKNGDDFYTRVTEKIIEERTKSGIKANDFLQTLIDAEVDNDLSSDNNLPGDNNLHQDNNQPGKGKLTKNEIIAQLVLFFAAGHETTSTLLKYSFYQLAVDQDMQDRLFDELSKSCAGDNFTYDNISNNIYLDSFIHEVLRMYPPGLLIERVANADYEITISDNKKITIPKGTLINVPIYAVHHNEDNFPNPQKFNLDRFLPENKSQIKPYSWLPFGAGNRNCIGMRFAIIEAKILIVKLITTFKILPTDQTKITFTKGSRFLSSDDIFVSFEER